MKTLIKILFAIIVIHAVARGGIVALNYYQLKDTTRQLLTFGSQVPPAQIHNQILSVAWDKGLPLVSENVLVQRQGTRTVATASYTAEFEYFPNNFYPVDLSFEVEAFSLNPGAQDKK